MSLSAALERERSRTRPCKLGRVRDLLSSEDRDELDQALAGDLENRSALLRALNDVLKPTGVRISYSTLTKHHDRVCPCYG